ncbi:N-acetylmuramoyl-L-alanine amidase [Anaerotaenia torta]|uniref:N-acetylmuramoyl-L-alanine amidase family protein n=1 Tax=Anaerotaenia torta TaxID=433293 RepID=UPI003D1DA25C
MDKSLLRKAAMQSVALMIAIITASYALQQYRLERISASDIINTDTYQKNDIVVETVNKAVAMPIEEEQAPEPAAESFKMDQSLAELESQVEESLMNQLGDRYLVIEKPESGESTLSLEDLYMEHSIRLHITGLSDDSFDCSGIMRVRGSDVFLGEPRYQEIVTLETDEEDGTVTQVVTRDYGKDLSHGATLHLEKNETTGLFDCDMLMVLDQVYAYIIHEDENYYFIDLRKPSEVYDKVLVIDPGHGGKDAGAVSKDEKYYEKNINLNVALALKEMLDKENIKVYYTRTADSKVFLRPRVTMGNAVDCDYYISIHCNSSTVTSPNGAEVLYYDREYYGVSNKKLAQLFSDELGEITDIKQRGVVLKRDKEIFIMDKAQVPMILIEIGYLSNQKDLDYLIDAGNQQLIARGIYNGIMRAFEELPAVRE